MKTPQPNQLRYTLNEALHAAEVLEHPMFQTLRKEWRVKAEKDGVIAIRRLNVEDVTPSLEFEVTDLFDVMETIIKNSEHNFTLSFPSLVSIDGLEKFLDKYDYEFSATKGLKVNGLKAEKESDQEDDG